MTLTLLANHARAEETAVSTQARNRPVARLAVFLNSPFLYGMERAVIELFSVLRPEIDPVFLLSHVTLRENLPVLKEIERRGLPHVFMPDRKPWPRLGKPRSLPHLFRMILAVARGAIVLFKTGAATDALYISSLFASPYAIPLAVYLRVRRRSVVHHFHDLKHNRLLMRMWAPFVTDFVHNSQYCQETVLTALPYLRKKRNHVVPYIMDLPVGNRFVAEPGKRHLVIVGRASAEKGMDYVLEAFKRIAAEHPDTTLHIVGACAPQYEEEFQRRVGEARRCADVQFWGYRENALDFLRGAYLHIQATPPSRVQESFPRVALEAMASGVPTVCFASGGLQDMIQDGVTGIMCKEESVEALAAGMTRFLADPAFRDRCASNARQRYLREYSASTLRHRWLDLLAGNSSA